MGWRKRKRHTFLYIILIIILIIGLAYAYNFGGFKNYISNIKVPNTTNSNILILTNFEDINRNPSNYVDKNITIKGKWVGFGGGCGDIVYNCESIGDNQGYVVHVVTIVQRDVEQTYTFTGTFTEGNYLVEK